MGMQVLKDYINQEVSLTNDYTHNELLALMVMNCSGINEMEYIIDSSESIIEPRYINSIASDIQPINKHMRFELIEKMLAVVNVKMQFPIRFLVARAKKILKNVYSYQDISIFDIVNSNDGSLMYIFKFGDTYMCNMSSLEYDPYQNNVYSLQNNVKVFANSHYGVWDVSRNLFRYVDTVYRPRTDSFVFNQPRFLNGDTNDLYYQFDSKEDFNKALKIFESNRELFKQLYGNGSQ